MVVVALEWGYGRHCAQEVLVQLQPRTEAGLKATNSTCVPAVCSWLQIILPWPPLDLENQSRCRRVYAVLYEPIAVRYQPYSIVIEGIEQSSGTCADELLAVQGGQVLRDLLVAFDYGSSCEIAGHFAYGDQCVLCFFGAT